MQNLQMQCKGCKESKAQSECYLVDGGLGIEGIENLRFEVCKECIGKYQKPKKKNKYLDWQFIACYYVAQGSSNDFKMVSENVDSGMPQGSTIMAVQNFLTLFGKANGLPNYSTQHKRVFGILQTTNKESLCNVVKKMLEIDYNTFYTKSVKYI